LQLAVPVVDLFFGGEENAKAFVSISFLLLGAASEFSAVSFLDGARQTLDADQSGDVVRDAVIFEKNNSSLTPVRDVKL
jgi:hypothetical protein